MGGKGKGNRPRHGKASWMDWHRLFGLLLTDYFTDSPYEVELEKDLSARHQLLDVVVLRKHSGEFVGRLPDGLDDLADFNLITFKSHHESLDDWALKELTGHYVNFRKQAVPARAALLPEGAFRLYAVCSRFPHNLANAVSLAKVGPGVYDCRRGTDLIRVVVVRELPETEHIAPLHLFSAAAEKVAYGAAHYRRRSEQTSTVLNGLLKGYQKERLNMPYTMQDFLRDDLRERLQELTPAQRLEGLSPKEVLAGLSPEQVEQLRRMLQAGGLAGGRRSRKKDSGTKPAR